MEELKLEWLEDAYVKQADLLQRKDEENKALEEMYANTFAILRDLEKEFSDMKANLHRAYNGLENYKKIKSENAQLVIEKISDESKLELALREIQQLKEALKELIPIAKDRLFSIPVKSLGDVDETIERVSKLI